MIYAYRQDPDQVLLYISESGRPAPAGYTQCSAAAFREAWRLRDMVRMRQLFVATMPPILEVEV